MRTGVVLLLVAFVAAALWGVRGPGPLPSAALPPPDPAQVARGEYLARVGHCAGCHTARGGAPYAGGRPLATPYGTVFAANLTPDATGLAGWSEEAFWRALHAGRSADGRALVPACPYPNFTNVDRAEVADLFAYLRSLPPVAQARPPHALRWPYGTQWALSAWRLLYFREGQVPKDSTRSAAWNRGAALVGGLAHCSACHGSRNAFSATDGPLDLRGGPIPMQGWVAPALDRADEAGLAGWPLQDIVALLRDGAAPGASVSGPMAMVVAGSTQHWSEADLLATATYLQALPQRTGPVERAAVAPAELMATGARLYERHCADCHGAQGQGREGWPALAGRRAVQLADPTNMIRVVLGGGFGPATRTRPRPLGMPPFATKLNDAELAAVVSYVRGAWGHRASAVTAFDIARSRGGQAP